MAGNFSVKIEGLEKLKRSLGKEKIEKEIAISMGLFARKLHSELQSSLSRTYDLGKNAKSLNSVLVGNSTSTQKFGQNFIETGLTYRNVPIPLSQYPHSHFVGNINKPPAKRPGHVFYTKVRRGNVKIVYGKKHYGGFIPVNTSGKEVLSRGRLNMYERKRKSRKPVRLLFGPSLADQVLSTLKYDRKVQQFIESFPQFVADNIKL